ncbi:GNAT family N-acetyltransferase [Streptomyces albipurpureus]|uniref:GNAT family N-acetyltransferase n=1 Tax=Streptomyces albipurpureus TaxID=2897419 RepID=A0ABT0UY51_9ACTN|nr:GNAT family N-acetyltransferase [Streptomyces sp. CWNU-1]MCM2392575.1 GNAT family N-acetyltransferase [Streptomyces sp. CWNU-1]
MYPVNRGSARLILRECQIGDVEAVYAIYGDAEVTRHLSFEPRSKDDVDAIVTRGIAAATVTPRSEYALAVVERDSNALVGVGRLALDPHQQSACTFGFALRADVWGKGFGRETVDLLLGLAFEELALHRVWGARSPLNSASASTMAAAGMVEEGTIRGHIQKSGVWRDSVVHAILDHEWVGAPRP